MRILIKKSATANFETIEIDDTPLGKGGQGAVHKIETSSYSADYCIKIYIRDAEKMHEKIEYMVAHQPRCILDASFRICWPTALAYNTNKEFIGYMMPLAFPKGHDLTILSVYRSKPLSQIKRYANKVEWHNKYELDTKDGILNRIKMLCNISIALHSIHSTGRYVLVDLKPENIDATGTGKVSIMDTDSIQISENGKILHPATAFTPEYFAPEGKAIQQSNLPFPVQCDYFAAAVCFYQILTGTHPYSGTVLKPPYDNCTELSECIANGLFAFGEKQQYISLPTGFNLQQNFYNLPLTVQALFKRAFSSHPSDRPTMEEWGRKFHEIITGGIAVGASTIKRTGAASIPLKITGVAFADEDYNRNVIRSAGSKLFTDVTYLCPIVSYTVLNAVGNVDVNYKIIDPKGALVTNSNTKGTLDLSKSGTYARSISGWGNKAQTAYKNPGEYHIEFYYNGKCIYKTTFTIYDADAKNVSVPMPPTSVRASVPLVPLKITKVGFKDCDNSGYDIRSEGSTLYTDVKYLTPVIYYDVYRPVSNAQIWIKTISPSGKILTSMGSNSGRYVSGIDLSNVKSGMRQSIAGWGNNDGTLYSESGTYKVEIYYENTLIHTENLSILRKGSSVTTKSTSSYGGASKDSLWTRIDDFITDVGDWFEDCADDLSESVIWAFILGIPALIGLIIGAIRTESIIGGILVLVLGGGVTFYVVAFCSVVVGFIARIILYVLRYLFYSIYTLLLVLIVVLGIVLTPYIKDLTDGRLGSKPRAKTEVVTPVLETTTYYCIANDKLNIRREPHSSAVILGVLMPGQSVEVYSVDGDWAQIKHNGSKAYVSAKYIARR